MDGRHPANGGGSSAISDILPGKLTRRLAKSSVEILQRWFTAHRHHPYPNDFEKDALSEQTGLTHLQISNWMANTRRRSNKRDHEISAMASPAIQASMSVPNLSSLQAWDEMDPLTRWRNSPPDEEPVAFSTIVKAMPKSSVTNTSGVTGNWTPPVYLLQHPSSSRAMSDTSFESMNSLQSSGASSGQSASSADSAMSFRNPTINIIHHSRRRRSQHLRGVPIAQRPFNGLERSHQARIYQCTFCTHTFKNKYDWTRHEGSLHLVLER